MSGKTDLWFNIARPNPSARLRLFCFPYAGGGASVFADWAAHLGGSVEVVAVQPPGRGNRFVEPPISSLKTIVTELAEAIFPLLNKPFAFFGHSNGALISYELAKALMRKGHARGLRHMIVSGNPAPQVRKFETVLHHLPDEELKQKLRDLRGTPEEILQNSELLEMFMPVLRADFAIAETHTHEPCPALKCDLSIFGGMKDDGVSEDDLRAWGDLFHQTTEMKLFPGGHFFINEDKAAVLAALRSRLDEVIRANGQTLSAV